MDRNDEVMNALEVFVYQYEAWRDDDQAGSADLIAIASELYDKLPAMADHEPELI